MIDDYSDGDHDATAVGNGVTQAPTQCLVSIQTDLTMKDFSEIESDFQSWIEEMHVLKQGQHSSRGYPTKEQLENDQKVLSFYECFGILMAIFEFVQKGNSLARKYKLPDFESFLLTIMKL